MKIIKTVRRQAFTLIEMIGVLAVIAILAALLIPKIFEAINNARVNNACITLATVKTALADHYAKYGSLASDSGSTLTIPAAGYPAFDKILLREGFIDKPFAVKISSDTAVTIQLKAGVASDTDVDGTNSAYDLDGSTTAPSLKNEAGPATAVVCEAVIPGVTANDALELSRRLDGESALGLTEADASTADLKGRVKYAQPSGGTTTVHVYLTHR